MRRVLVLLAIVGISAPALADEAPRAATVAADVKPLAPAIATRHAKLFAVLRADLKPKIAMAARILAARASAPLPKDAKRPDLATTARAVVADAHNFGLSTVAPQDVEALVVLVMMQTAKDADDDLRAIAEEMKKLKERKDALREESEAMQRRLQALQERRTKVEEALSNLLKKASDTDAGIVQNLK